MIKRLLEVLVLSLLWCNISYAELINYAVQVSDDFSISYDLKIKISDDFSISYDEKWKVVGACANAPNIKVKLADDFSISYDKKIKIVDDFSISYDKKVCITNANSLDRQTLKKLRLIN